MMKLLLNVSILKNMRSFSGYKIGIISKSYPRIRDGRCLGGIKRGGGGGELGGTDGRKGFKLCKKYHRSAFLNTSYINNIIVIYKTFQT